MGLSSMDTGNSRLRIRKSPCESQDACHVILITKKEESFRYE